MKRGLLCLLLVVLPGLLGAPAQAKVTRYLTGNAADVVVSLAGPAHDLGGGGTDVDAALQWIIDQVRGCTSCSTKIDVVILRATGTDGYNAYIYAMNGVDSVETLVITKAADANTTAVETTIKNAEVVFYAGGDQCDYTTLFKGTKVETATEFVYAKGGGVGGTSAGLAIQGDFTYDGCAGSVTSSQALADPYHRYVTFTYDFFHWANLQSTITDSHFVTRDRMGRTLAFLARQIKDGKAASALSIAINEATSVEVSRTGLATVVGDGPAYFILADHAPENCVAGTPLTYSNYKIWKVNAGGTFNLANRPTTGYYLRSVNNGVIDQNPY
jgi:cyanophycinase-like exopeptidase